MQFLHYIPCDALKPYIRTFVIHEAIDESQYKVLPDTGLVIGFQFKGKLSEIKDMQKIPLAVSGVTGLTDRFKIFRNEANIGSVLVYFKEMGATSFFKQPLHELFRESVSLENFMLRSELLVVEEQLYEAKTNERRISIVEQFLLARLSPIQTDKLVASAIALIYKSKGSIRIRQLSQQLNISQSPLEKRFRQTVGTTVKKFASIVRMKHAISQYSHTIFLTALGYEAGFYDQAHFIKEFKNFTGETPVTFFSSGSA